MNLLTTESFSDVFGKKTKRKKPKLEDGIWDVASLARRAQENEEVYDEMKDSNIRSQIEYRAETAHKMFEKGQSRRIWSELFKVIDSSDVVVQVLDARDPMGTRSRFELNDSVSFSFLDASSTSFFSVFFVSI